MDTELNKKIIKEIASYILKETNVDISSSESLLKSFEIPKLDIQELYEYNLIFTSFELSKLLFGNKQKENQGRMEEIVKNLGVHLTDVFQKENHGVIRKVEGKFKYLNFYFKSEHIGKLLYKINDGSLFQQERKSERVNF